MSRDVLTRRGFLASALTLLVVRTGAATPSADSAHGCAHAGAHAGPHTHAHRDGPHPTPRKGITAARVVPAAKLEDESHSARTAFEEVRQVPGIVDGIRCHCGCADNDGSYSLLSCYEGDGMARHCQLCQGQGRMAYRLHREGRTLAEIRAAIDERYGE